MHTPHPRRPGQPRPQPRSLVFARARGRWADGLPGRLLGRHLAPQMVGLWLLEVLICALLIDRLLPAGLAHAALGGSFGDGWSGADKAAVLALTFGLTSIAVGLYNPDSYLRTRFLLVNTAIGAILAFPALWVVGQMVGIDIVGLSAQGGVHAARALLAWTLLLFGLRLGFSYALRGNLFVRRVLILGPDAAADRLAQAMATMRHGFFEVAGVLPVERAATLGARRVAGRRVWGVILAGDAADAVPARHLLRAQARGLRLCSDTEFWERQLRRLDLDATEPAATLSATGAPLSGRGRLDAALHRVFDVVLSLTLLLFTLPLMLLTALAIRLDSRGPVLYRQERVGLGGTPFTLLKFRSMRTDAEARGPVWAAQRDPRVTRVGGFIRLVRIDELPQLVNILRGQMSFIGPRPERPHFVQQLEQIIPAYAERALVKPGLTGWAQVNYPYGASVEDARAKLSYDLYYIKHRSLLLDVMILLATVRVVLFQRGAR